MDLHLWIQILIYQIIIILIPLKAGLQTGLFLKINLDLEIDPPGSQTVSDRVCIVIDGLNPGIGSNICNFHQVVNFQAEPGAFCKS